MKRSDPFQTLSSVKPEKVHWLWKPYIPFGMTTIIEGDPGIGKSYLVTYLASQISTGGTLPDGGTLKRGNVLYFSAEDDPSYTIRPRVDAMAGDPNRIRFQADYSAFDDKGLKLLRQEVQTFPPKLIVIDPLYAYVPSGSDMYRPNEIRALLAQINEVAVYCGAAIVIIRHLTKGKRDKAIYQGAGSMDVIGVARSGLLVAVHPDDPDLRVIAHIKHNLSARGESWMYELEKAENALAPILKWSGRSTLSADELLAAPQASSSALDQASEFLRDALASGAKPAQTLISDAEKRAISERTLNRAKRNLGVVVTKSGERWMWKLPPV